MNIVYPCISSEPYWIVSFAQVRPMPSISAVWYLASPQSAMAPLALRRCRRSRCCQCSVGTSSMKPSAVSVTCQKSAKFGGYTWWLHFGWLYLVIQKLLFRLDHSFLFLASPAPALMASSCPEETRRTRLPWLSNACKSLKPEIDASGLSFPDAPLTSIDPLA